MTVVITRAEPVVAPFGAADVPGLLAMHDRCSDETRYHRWHGRTRRFPAGYLAALLAGAPGQLAVSARVEGELVGVGSAAEVAPGRREIGILVEDAWQHRGVGRRLLAALVEACAAAGADHLYAEVLDADAGLVDVLRRLGPTVTRPSHGVLSATVRLWA